MDRRAFLGTVFGGAAIVPLVFLPDWLRGILDKIRNPVKMPPTKKEIQDVLASMPPDVYPYDTLMRQRRKEIDEALSHPPVTPFDTAIREHLRGKA